MLLILERQGLELLAVLMIFVLKGKQKPKKKNTLLIVKKGGQLYLFLILLRTAAYLSPEVIEGKEFTVESDVCMLSSFIALHLPTSNV